ncbi:MAG: FAD-binding protein [Gemmatimonadota bacterium]
MVWETDVRLAEHTRYRIGGPAGRFGRARTREELAEAVRSLEADTYRVLGGGANVLVADAGVPEAVLVLEGEFDYVRVGGDAIEAGAAAGLPVLVGDARRAARAGYSFLEAVPGTVGGGLRMNAGSADVGLWDRVLRVEALTPEGEVVRLTPADASPTYRAVGVPESWIFLGGTFEAPGGDRRRIETEHQERRREKVASQVYDLPSCGSTWKNPGGDAGSAWEVVDRVGMRGARRGGAMISDRHSNFIANLGDATAADVLWLMTETRRRAHEELGIWLEAEIRLWGFEPDEVRSAGGDA